MIKLPQILPAPKHPSNLPDSAKWLAGEGAGSWFVIEETENSFQYRISRFSPDGLLECKGLFSVAEKIDFTRDFSISYPSHCATITIIQGDTKATFTSIGV